jgi:hypothetical protein
MSEEAGEPFFRLLILNAGESVPRDSCNGGRSLKSAVAWAAAAARDAARRGCDEHYIIEQPDGVRHALTMEAAQMQDRVVNG